MQTILDRLAKLFAIFGGLVMVVITFITTYSIVGRWLFNSPLLGDTELVEFAMAMAVAAFLPICQWRGGNIIVDFFTNGASDRTKSGLDRFGALSIALMTGLIAWRSVLGGIGQKADGSVTMLMQLPEWMAYAAMVPPIALTAVIALYTAVSGRSGKE